MEGKDAGYEPDTSSRWERMVTGNGGVGSIKIVETSQIHRRAI